jgi:hypothetical protein
MIKLKLNSADIKAVIYFCQVSIELAREENKKTDLSKFFIKIAERIALIDELEGVQKKLVFKIDKLYPKKTKGISISKSAGYFIVQAHRKTEIEIDARTPKNDLSYTNFVMNQVADTIIHSLI